MRTIIKVGIRGKLAMPQSCPVAVAIRKVVKRGCLISVGPDDATITRSKFEKGWKTKLPEAAKLFILAFDRGLKVKPFTFKLNIPKEYLRGST
jgi:hypothetical protein